MPQSTRKRTSPVSTSVQEPVTSPAAPRNTRRMFEFLPTWRSMILNKAKCNAGGHSGVFPQSREPAAGLAAHRPTQEVKHVQAYLRPDRRIGTVACYREARRVVCQGSRRP